MWDARLMIMKVSTLKCPSLKILTDGFKWILCPSKAGSQHCQEVELKEPGVQGASRALHYWLNLVPASQNRILCILFLSFRSIWFCMNFLWHLGEFVRTTVTGLCRCMSTLDEDSGLTEVMGHLVAARDRQNATDTMFQPLKDTLLFLVLWDLGCGIWDVGLWDLGWSHQYGETVRPSQVRGSLNWR